MDSAKLARWEARLRPFLTRLPPAVAVRLYSRGRRTFLARFSRQVPSRTVDPAGLARTLWGLRFRSGLFNAAGMFKNGEGYEVTWRQGAGAYLAGTTTYRPRSGNRAHGTTLPFAPYPRSGAASNWLGLPNLGHRAVAERIAALERHDGFPVGASLAVTAQDGRGEEERLDGLVEGLGLYEAAGVNFLEINESCPNTDDSDSAEAEGFDALRERLTHVRDGFLRRRRRSLPVIVKFSCDTRPAQVSGLVTLLADLGFDGVNFGNTSIAYGDIRSSIAGSERSLFDHFTRRFRGGVSGRPLKPRSLELAKAAVGHLQSHAPEQELHVVRTGGIEEADDLHRSDRAGVALNQWYSGYFDAFSRHGHALYRELYAVTRAAAGAR